MASHVQVVLQQDVANLGRVGDVVRVRAGYARNYLVPRSMASVATRGNVERLEQARKEALARAAKSHKDAEGLAAVLAEITLGFQKPMNAEGKLFGSVTTAEIARELNAKGYPVDRRKISLPDEQIRQAGVHEVSVKLAEGVSATLKVEVSAAES